VNRRIGMLSVALVAIVASAPPSPSRAAEAAVEANKSWCMTYCDAIYLGCMKTFGWFDEEACEEWKEGCLDGCRVND